MRHRRSSLTRRPLAKALLLLFITALLAVALGTTPAPGQSVQAAPGGRVSPEGLLNPDGTLDLSTDFQGTLELRGWEVILDGERGPVLKPASRSAAASVTAWHALSNRGLDLRVRALAVSNSDLYVGGRFTQTNDGLVTDLDRIARYDTAATTWNALSTNQGLSDEVLALAVVGSDLYAGGSFTQTADGTVTNLNYIARYDTTAATWHALPNKGLNGTVFALAVVGNDLYVGGTFNQTGDGSVTNLNYIARYDTAVPAWHALPKQGLYGNVYVLATAGSDVYVGGGFSQTDDGTVLNLGNVARYDTTGGAWHALPDQGLDATVTALAVSGSDLYAGGSFTQTADGTVTNLNYIARCDTTGDTWYALFNQGLDSQVFVLAVVGSDLYAGGGFTQTGDGSVTNLGYIARYDTTTTTWNALPNQGFNGWVYTLAVVGSDLYVGGEFNQTGDGTVTNLVRIARYGRYLNEVYLPLVVRQ